MIKYTTGFAFDKKLENVLLIRKNRPEWQKGKLNGLGGLIEHDEIPILSLIREFEEECGIKTNVYMWTHISTIYGDVWCVDFFSCICDITKATKTTDENIEIIPINQLYKHSCVNSISWLIPLAIYWMSNPYQPNGKIIVNL